MEQAQEEKRGDAAFDGEGRFEGTIHISEEVIVELAKKTIQGISNIQTINTGIASKFGISRKGADGVRVSVEDGKTPCILVDAYVLVKYGQRIPDLAWDVQEKIKVNLERYTGYSVKSVNINVQGIYIDEPVELESGPEDGVEAAAEAEGDTFEEGAEDAQG